MPSKSGSSKQEPTATTPLTASSASAAATPASSVNGALSDPYIRGVVFLLSGALFGAALQRGRVHESLTVVAQMTFSRLIMLKMFLAASGTAALVVYFLENVLKVPTTRDRMTSGFKRGLPFVAGGAALLGIGMTLSGSCPGTVYAQIGAGSRNAWVILLGGFVGAGLYSLLDAYLAKQDNTKKLSEGRLEGSGSFVNFFGEKTPLFIGGGMLAFVFILELLVNWKSDLKGIENHATFSTANPAIVSGILIGLVQFPLIYFSGKQLGSSTSFVCMLGNCVPSYKESYVSNSNPLLSCSLIALLAFPPHLYVALPILSSPHPSLHQTHHPSHHPRHQPLLLSLCLCVFPSLTYLSQPLDELRPR